MSAKTFKEAWAEKEAQGYHYGADALEHVHFGWQIAHEALLADAPDVARVAREYRDNAAKYPIDSEAGQRLGFVAHCIESLAAQSAVQQARIRELVCQSPSPVRRTP